MSLLDSFIHGDALTEILIEGHHPYARQTLNAPTVLALRAHLHASDQVLACLVGREVQAGAAVWVLTSRHLLICQQSDHAVTALAHSELKGFEAVRGRYGHTVRMHTSAHTRALFGVDAELASGLHQAVQTLGLSSSFEHKPALGTLWSAHPSPTPTAQQCLDDARQRLLAA